MPVQQPAREEANTAMFPLGWQQLQEIATWSCSGQQYSLYPCIRTSAPA